MLRQHIVQDIQVAQTSEDLSLHRYTYRDVYSFPLDLTTNYTLFESDHRFAARVDNYGYDRARMLPEALGGVAGRASLTRSNQRGEAEITGRKGRRSTGWGEMSETYEFVGPRGETYEEEIRGALRFPLACRSSRLLIPRTMQPSMRQSFRGNGVARSRRSRLRG